MTGSVMRSNGRAGFSPWKIEMIPAATKSNTGMSHDPYACGKSGCQPPRNSSVATEVIVIMFAYSAMKKAAKLMELYSVWKPATSSFSASGRSNGMRFVSANAQIRKMMKLKTCGNGPCKIVQRGRNPKYIAVLHVDHLPQAEGIQHQQRRGECQRHRQFVADHLRRGAQSAEQRVLAVRCPSGQRDPIYAHRGQRQDEQDTDLEIRHLHVRAHADNVRSPDRRGSC